MIGTAFAISPGEYPINTQHGKKPPRKGNLLVAGDNFMPGERE
jgi:hypothetical protein